MVRLPWKYAKANSCTLTRQGYAAEQHLVKVKAAPYPTFVACAAAHILSLRYAYYRCQDEDGAFCLGSTPRRAEPYKKNPSALSRRYEQPLQEQHLPYLRSVRCCAHSSNSFMPTIDAMTKMVRSALEVRQEQHLPYLRSVRSLLVRYAYYRCQQDGALRPGSTPRRAAPYKSSTLQEQCQERRAHYRED
jgi:hypothetical protein